MKSRFGFMQKIAVGVVCIVVFAYTVYHVASIFREDISTYAAGITTESTTLSYNGYMFRDEQLLTSSNSGVVDYSVVDGTKVSEGQLLAVAYEEGRSEQGRVTELDRQIRLLNESLDLTGDNSDIVAVKDKNNDTYDALVKLLGASDTGGFSYQAEKLLVGMNRASEISGGSNAGVTLDRLYAEQSEIFSQSGDGEECKSPKNGYFFSGADGCEKYFTIDALVFKDLKSRSAVLRNRKTGRALKVDFPFADYFLLWHKPASPYICLEPWAGVQHPVNASYDITEKEGIIKLSESGEYYGEHTITVIE